MIFGYRAGLLPTRCWSDHASPGLQLWCKSLIFSGVVTTRFAEKPLINKGWHGSENHVLRPKRRLVVIAEGNGVSGEAYDLMHDLDLGWLDTLGLLATRPQKAM